MTVAFSSYFFSMKSASKVCLPKRSSSIACVALSFERTRSWSLKFDIAVAGTLREPPKRSQWISCASDTVAGPPSHLTPPDQTWGLRVEVSVSSVEYWTAKSNPPISGTRTERRSRAARGSAPRCWCRSRSGAARCWSTREVAARDAEERDVVAVFLEGRVHAAELDRAPALVREADERIALREGGVVAVERELRSRAGRSPSGRRRASPGRERRSASCSTPSRCG